MAKKSGAAKAANKTKVAKKAAANSPVTRPEAPPQPRAGARALLVGLTHIDPYWHDGWDGRNGCVGCAADVISLTKVLADRGWETRHLLDDEATAGAVISELASLTAEASPGDCIFFYFSGHGGQVRDANSDEADGMDETLVCFDGHLVDDRLNELWLSCREGVRIYMISDSCNSGTNYRLFEGTAPSVKLRAISTSQDMGRSAQVMRAHMLHLGGCRDGRTSLGLQDGGVFTKSLVARMEAGFSGTWRQLFEKVTGDVADSQDPAINLYPEAGNTLDQEPSFAPPALPGPRRTRAEPLPTALAMAPALIPGMPGVPLSSQGAPAPVGFPIADGEEMLRRIDLALIARAKAAETGARAFAAEARAPVVRLVAEGDSWFDFKIEPDIIDWLRRDYGYDIENVAMAGACVYEMAYGPDDDSLFDAFGRDASQLEEVVKKIRQHKPHAFLLSGAGNDFVGPEFILAIHHAAAKKSGINRGVIEALFKDEVEPGLRRIIETVTAAARQAGLGNIPVVTHGYDHVFPDGRTALNLVLKKVGPWMHPSFSLKGYPYRNEADLLVRRKIVAGMIDALYVMLERLRSDYPNVRVVDVRGALPARSDWHDELHPSRDGFRRVAARFHAVIDKVLFNRSAPRGVTPPVAPP